MEIQSALQRLRGTIHCTYQHFCFKVCICKGAQVICFSKWFQGVNEISYQKYDSPDQMPKYVSVFEQYNSGIERYEGINGTKEAKWWCSLVQIYCCSYKIAGFKFLDSTYLVKFPK